jgi:Ca-activated chloride channel family protein
MSNQSIQLTIGTELSLIPQDNPSQRTLEVVIHPPEAKQNKPRPKLNLALVLDRSGSMSGEKLAYVKEAARHLIDLMTEQDRVAVVAYDDNVTHVARSSLMTPEVRRTMKQSIQEIKTGGSTNLGDGWLTGCGEVSANHVEGVVERSLLLTDGLANQGIIDQEELSMHSKELYHKGVSTSTFGVGADYNEHLLEAIANAGGGSYYYIGSPQDIPTNFAQEFKELLEITARDVELSLELPEGVSAQVLGAWGVETSAGKLRVVIGALQAGRPQPVYLTLNFPPADTRKEISLKVRVMARGEGDQVLESMAEITFQYADQKMIDSAPRDQALIERVVKVRMAEAVNEALKLERNDQREEAFGVLKQAIEANRPYLRPDELQGYEEQARRIHRGMEETDRKSLHSLNYASRKSRDMNQK